MIFWDMHGFCACGPSKQMSVSAQINCAVEFISAGCY